MMAFPQGLPEWDPVREALEEREELAGTSVSRNCFSCGLAWIGSERRVSICLSQHASDHIEPEEAELWYAGKRMKEGNKLADHLGRNEKTKVVAKLQKKGSGPPQREPPISEEEHKQMLAHYRKKQEEQKKLEEADDDHHLNAPWANPNSLKNHFRGVSDVKVRGLASFKGFNQGLF